VIFAEGAFIKCKKQKNSSMEISYHADRMPSPEQIIALYDNAGLPRPTTDAPRIQKMYENSNLVVTAWHNDQLIGVSRSITDWAWSCYLSDLAIRKEYQKAGIGRELIRLTKEKVGEQSMVLLLSVDTALDYYPRVGMEQLNNAFIIKREV
jgi:GNAT superfamily N-acetyltransferase